MSAATNASYQPHTITATLNNGRTVVYVSSADGSHYYKVAREYGHLTCTCPAGQHHKACKHIAYVAAKLNAERKQPQATFACARTSLPLTRAERREAALMQTEQEIVWVGGLPLKAS